MSTHLSDNEIAEALNECASEPVHMPGIVQPYGVLVVLDPNTRVVASASANIADIFEMPASAILGKSFDGYLDRETWHAIQNAFARSPAGRENLYVCDSMVAGKQCTIHAFKSGEKMVIELEKAQVNKLSGAEGLRTLSYLTKSIEECETQKSVFDLVVKLLRHLTGYDRVMLYRFDSAWNGEIVAEEKRRSMESFLGLHFPHWDIPAQARTMMEKIPVRFIENVDQVPVSLHASTADEPPIDISLAYCRGVSTVHMEYLRNMGIASTMTLTLKLANRLWGIVSFHNKEPSVPAPELRELLRHIGQTISTKLQLLEQEDRLQLVSRVDALKDEVLNQLEEDGKFDAFAETILRVLNADGIVVKYEDTTNEGGALPETPIIDFLLSTGLENSNLQCIENLSEEFPNLANATNGCAGVIIFAPSDDRQLLVFRKSQEKLINWAGNPNKTIEEHDGRLQLSPRGSFSSYLETVRGTSKEWSEQDRYFASRIWTLVNSVQRRELIMSLNRQQKVLIDELNHRVRNILALVRSVSQQAQNSSHGSLTTYSRSLEARIQALAASHDLASSSLIGAVPLIELIKREFTPYLTNGLERTEIQAINLALRPDVAPIFSLVIHELVTNALKYGALSTQSGKVKITFSEETDNQLTVYWQEFGGPTVVTPNQKGFGTTLIEQAVPYELDGRAQLRFSPTGIEADFELPMKLFDTSEIIVDLEDQNRGLAFNLSEEEASMLLVGTSCLVVEDSFLIAKETGDQLRTFGVSEVEIENSVRGAYDYLDEITPSFVLMDVNLGGNETSLPIAERLTADGIPFLFVTGYGDNTKTAGAFRNAARVTKPITTGALRAAIIQLLIGK